MAAVNSGIVANLDMTAPGSGVLLVTGGAWADCPQALVGRQDGQWYIEDSYGDPGREDFFGLGRTRKVAVRKYMKHLGVSPEGYELKIQREW